MYADTITTEKRISLDNVVELTLGDDFKHLELAQNITELIVRTMAFPEDSECWITLAVREGVANAMIHGNKMDPNKQVTLRFEMATDKLTITVVDQGTGFDPTRVPDPLQTENLLKSSGRGLYYIRSFMDEVEFKASPEGMALRMVKRRSGNLKPNES
jgi:serine/threonine-protein kinase RsbW